MRESRIEEPLRDEQLALQRDVGRVEVAEVVLLARPEILVAELLRAGAVGIIEYPINKILG